MVWCVRWEAVAAAGLVLAVSGCGSSTGGGFRVDDHERDKASCGTGEDSGDCRGVSLFRVVANPDAGEYAVIWEADYADLAHGGTQVYARRFDAGNGRPRGPSVTLPGMAGLWALGAVHDPATRSYVVASQDIGAGSDVPRPPVRVQRFSEGFEPRGSARELGNWSLKSMAIELRGRVALVGADHEQPLGAPSDPSIPPLELVVDVLDSTNRTVSRLRHRVAQHGEVFASRTHAAYSASSGRLLILWTSPTRRGPWTARVESVGANGWERTMQEPAPQDAPNGETGIACSPTRRDCLVVYAVEPTRRSILPDLYGQALNDRGLPMGARFRIATSTRGTVGLHPAATGYAVGWNQGPIGRPTRTRVVVADVTGSSPRIVRRFDHKVDGPALLAGDPSQAAELLVSQPPSGDQGSFQLYGRVLRP